VAEDPNAGSPPDGAEPPGPFGAAAERSATAPGAGPSGAIPSAEDDSADSPTADPEPRRPRRPRPGRDPGEAAVEAELSKRRRVVAVRLSEVEHLAWRREAAADKRAQLGAWTRSVVAAEIARRHGGDVADTAAENGTGGGAVVVLNESVVRELSQQLVRVGNLLNQVTRLAHTEARSGGVDASTMAQVVSGIDQTRATIAALDGRLEEMSRR
jgi:hypothetical protein